MRSWIVQHDIRPLGKSKFRSVSPLPYPIPLKIQSPVSKRVDFFLSTFSFKLPMKQRSFFFSLVVLILCGCATVKQSATPSSKTTADEVALQALAHTLKDPDSVKWGSISTYSLDNGQRVIVGEWNGKNSYGGYVGFEAFYVRHSGGQIVARTSGALAREALSYLRQGFIPTRD